MISRKRQRKTRPALIALKEIIKYQKSTTLLILKRPFERLCKEILETTCWQLKVECRLGGDAIEAIQHATESYLVGIFEDVVFIADHVARITISVDDMRLCRRLRGRVNGGARNVYPEMYVKTQTSKCDVSLCNIIR